MHEPGCLVERRDDDHLGIEDLLDPVPDCVVDRLLVQLPRDRLLHAVDHRQLRVPLPRLLDRLRTRERRADVLADEREEIPVPLRVAHVVRIGLHHEHADDRSFGLERHPQPVPAVALSTQERDLAPAGELFEPLRRNKLGLAGAEDVRRDAPRRFALAELEPLVRIGEIELVLVDVVRPIDQAALLVVERDEDVPRVHELAYDGVDRPVELLHVLGSARELSDAIQSVLHLGGVRPLCLAAGHDSEYRALRRTRLGSRRDG